MPSCLSCGKYGFFACALEVALDAERRRCSGRPDMWLFAEQVVSLIYRNVVLV